MSADFPERRRCPRVSLPHAAPMNVAHTVRVRLMEISADGALLGADEALPVSMTGRLFATLGGQRFEAEFNVRRVDAHTAPVLHGVVLVPADYRDREALDDFMRKAGG